MVAFIVVLNMTIAIGTINGLVFYANIVFANRSLLLPPRTSKFLTIFISWLNLDLGIETCFYDGMDSYAKALLQLVFPSYVILLTAAIIVLAKCSVQILQFHWQEKGSGWHTVHAYPALLFQVHTHNHYQLTVYVHHLSR